MIKLTVHTNDQPHYILSSDIRKEILTKYPDDIEQINSLYTDMLTGSTGRVLQRTPLILGIYPHDVAKIFRKLNINVLFVDQDNKTLFIDDTLSGIYD